MIEGERKKKTKSVDAAYLSLCMTCSKMERCGSDARRSLYRWEVPPGEHQKIIDKLKAEKFIDEQRYADAYVREKVAAGRWGLNKITFGLKTKQIPDDMIQNALEQYADAGRMVKKLEEELKRRITKEQVKAKDDYDLRIRLFRFAASRGYGFDQINDILDRILKG